MALTRRERFARKRQLEKDAEVFAGSNGGVKLEVSADFKCDDCGKASGTLYNIDGKLLCYDSLPFEWRYGNKQHRILTIVVSGEKAIKAFRRKGGTR